MDRLFKPALLALALALVGGVSFGCNTLEGAAEGGEEDIEAVGENIDNAME